MEVITKASAWLPVFLSYMEASWAVWLRPNCPRNQIGIDVVQPPFGSVRTCSEVTARASPCLIHRAVNPSSRLESIRHVGARTTIGGEGSPSTGNPSAINTPCSSSLARSAAMHGTAELRCCSCYFLTVGKEVAHRRPVPCLDAQKRGTCLFLEAGSAEGMF
ncbi:hypothetical protein B0T18DRAFT_402491 [Schizothecium vesticola]|uniref:Secreted protein n=1 Tax=Schizothecium vesticola TaxID=314040 RepID=A0AA40F5X3_9PEZI|nr:hypothetical protein B0T18DRAFT_402491 [Schizothecium vesticola]